MGGGVVDGEVMDRDGSGVPVAKTPLLLLPLLLAAVCPDRAPAQTGPLTLDDALDLPAFADRQPVDLSPDGELVAVALVRPSRTDRYEPYTRAFVRSGVSNQTLGARVHLIDASTGSAEPLTPPDVTSWGAVWSPDGERLAFYSDEGGGPGLWVWDRRQRERRRLTEHHARPYFGFEAPRWCGKGRILFKALPEGMTIEELAALFPPRPGAESAAPGGDAPADVARVRLLASDDSLLGPAGAPVPAPARKEADGGEGGLAPADIPVSWTNSALADLVMADLSTGETTTVARRVRARGYACSPDGGRVAFTDMRWDDTESTVIYDLVVADGARGGAPQVLAEGALRDYGLSFSWGPAGRRLAWVEADGALVVAGAPSADARPEAWRPLHRITRDGLDLRTDYRPPLWEADGRRILFLVDDALWGADLDQEVLRPLRATGSAAASPDRRILGLVADVESGLLDGPRSAPALVVHDRRTQRMGFVDPGGEELWSADAYLGPDFPYHLDAEGERVVFVAQTARRPEDVWISDHGLRSVRRLSDLHPRIGRLSLGESRLVTWTSRAADTLRGPLLLPPGHQEGDRHPLVVLVYPDRHPAAWVNRFGVQGQGAYNLHLLATRGFAVFHPAAPFEPGRPVEGIADAVLPGVDRVVALGVADPDRIGVMGTSAGGYATLALLTRSNRWRAAIADQGFASLLSSWSNLRPDGTAIGVSYVEGYGMGLGASPWEEGGLDAFIAQSPFFAFDRIEAPVLLIHGSVDGTAPVEGSEQAFVALRRLGKPVALAVYEGEDHGMGGWSEAHIRDYWRRVWGWWGWWLR